MIQYLENDLLKIAVSTSGAELQSIENKRTGQQYLWNGDARFWKRRSPVLFPIVGALWNGKTHFDGVEFAMGQHGFARDMEFTPVPDAPEGELWFALASSDDTMKMFPRSFRLEIGYGLHDTRITVMWRVVNTGAGTLHFQIGAHPAFNLPEFNSADQTHGYFAVSASTLKAEIIAEKGCIGTDTAVVTTDGEQMIPITADTFSRDALIFGDHQLGRVSLLDKERRPVLTLLFRTPYVGLWAPAADAPFVCIEPWYGRADAVGFSGEFAERHAVNALEAGKRFDASYMIIIDNF